MATAPTLQPPVKIIDTDYEQVATAADNEGFVYIVATRPVAVPLVLMSNASGAWTTKLVAPVSTDLIRYYDHRRTSFKWTVDRRAQRQGRTDLQT